MSRKIKKQPLNETAKIALVTALIVLAEKILDIAFWLLKKIFGE